jgi:hypothetical protein
MAACAVPWNQRLATVELWRGLNQHSPGSWLWLHWHKNCSVARSSTWWRWERIMFPWGRCHRINLSRSGTEQKNLLPGWGVIFRKVKTQLGQHLVIFPAVWRRIQSWDVFFLVVKRVHLQVLQATPSRAVRAEQRFAAAMQAKILYCWGPWS